MVIGATLCPCFQALTFKFVYFSVYYDHTYQMHVTLHRLMDISITTTIQVDLLEVEMPQCFFPAVKEGKNQ